MQRGHNSRYSLGYPMILLPGLILALELSETNDEVLVRALQRRESQAMADSYDRFGRVVFSVVLGVVRDRVIAEDLTQETFLRAWNRAAGFDAVKGALGPWLLAIARNRAIDHVRSVSGRMDRNSFEFDAREHPSLFVDMEREVINKDHARVLRGAMAKLNQNHRQVIELAYYEGLSQSEMAERLSQPLGTIKTWVRAALKTLRDEIGQELAA